MDILDIFSFIIGLAKDICLFIMVYYVYVLKTGYDNFGGV